LEASNQQAREQLREAEANNGTSRSKGSARSKSPHGSSSTTIRSLSSAILSNDVTFEELSNQFASWQTETKPHDSTPQPVALAVLESKLHKWVKEAKLPKKRSSSKTGRIEWRTLTADFAKWKREHDTIKPLRCVNHHSSAWMVRMFSTLLTLSLWLPTQFSTAVDCVI
jgi:hypothetical protein